MFAAWRMSWILPRALRNRVHPQETCMNRLRVVRRFDLAYGAERPPCRGQGVGKVTAGEWPTDEKSIATVDRGGGRRALPPRCPCKAARDGRVRSGAHSFI